MSEYTFGIFDHVERTSGSPNLGELFEERLKLVEAYEQAGFSIYHVAEHHATPLGMAPSPNVYLSAVAQRTRRMRFGPLTYLLPFYNIIRLAEEICMLDHLSHGRLEVGVGRGVSPFEQGIHRIPYYESRARYAEALQVLMGALSGKPMTFHGQYYNYDNVPAEMEPLQKPHPPLWYGINSDDSSTYAAEHGMNAVSLGPNALVKRVTEVYHEKFKPGFGGPSPKVGAARQIYIADSDKEADTIARASFEVFHHNIQKLFLDFGASTTVFPNNYDLFQKSGAFIIGSPGTVRDKVAQFFQETGCTYLVLAFAWGNLTADQTMRSLDRFATKVMPEFRGQAAAAGR